MLNAAQERALAEEAHARIGRALSKTGGEAEAALWVTGALGELEPGDPAAGRAILGSFAFARFTEQALGGQTFLGLGVVGEVALAQAMRPWAGAALDWAGAQGRLIARWAARAPQELGSCGRSGGFWRVLPEEDLLRLCAYGESPEPLGRGSAGEFLLGFEKEMGQESQRRTDRSEGALRLWAGGFDSGAIASLAGSLAGDRLMMGLAREAPLSRVIQARDAGLSLTGISPEETAELLISVGCDASVEARRQEERESALWRGPSFEEQAKIKEDRKASAARRCERWRLIMEMGAPPARGGNQASASFVAEESEGLCVFAMEAGRGGFLSGERAGAVWLRLGAKARWPKAAAKMTGLDIDPRSNPLSWALGRGLDHKALESWCQMIGFLKIWSPEAIRAMTGAGCAAPRQWDALSRALKEGGLARMALAAGVRPSQMEPLAEAGVDFEPAALEGGLLLAWLESRRSGGAAEIQALLRSVERASRGGAARELARRSEGGAGPMCLAAKALCVESLAELESHGLSVAERDESGAGLLAWAASRYGKSSEKKLEALIEWLSERGFDFTATDKKGVSAATELARRGSPERLLALMRASPEAAERVDASGSAPLDRAIKRADAGGKSALESAALERAAAAAPAGARPRRRGL